MSIKSIIPITALLFLTFGTIQAQDNYEIQVYGSATQQKGSTIFELHTNYAIEGIKETTNGVYPTHHALHETLEITHGISENSELGFYVFSNYTPGKGYNIVGFHIRPRVKAPDRWGIPFGLSLSGEIGWQRPEFSKDTWSVEIRPIIDKQWGKFYLSFNPTFGVAVKSLYNSSTPSFEPNLKASYKALAHGAIGVEYYGGMGAVTHFDAIQAQTHAIYATYDMLDNTKWELDAGLGFGLTQSTEKLMAKVILGRRINWGKK